MAEVYVGINNWDDVNWYLKEGYFIGNPHGISFPGYFTLKFDLIMDDRIAALKKLVINAREKGIRITTDNDQALMKIGLPLEETENGIPDIRLLSNGKARKNAATPVDTIEEDIPEEKPEDNVSKAGEQLDERREQLRKCNAFFLRVANELKDTHRIIGSSAQWGSACLVPIGREDEVSYYGKPVNSLRVACNWNWRAALKRCKEEKLIQCNTPDLPWCKKREAPGMASKPIWGNMVGYFDEDKKYHCVYGEKFDRETKTWSWYEEDFDALVNRMKEKAEEMAIAQVREEAVAFSEPITPEEVDAAWNDMSEGVQLDEI